MKHSEYLAAQAAGETTWEERLRERQAELGGAPSDSCLLRSPAAAWPRKMFRSKLVVAAMCVGENGACDACLKLLRNS